MTLIAQAYAEGWGVPLKVAIGVILAIIFIPRFMKL